jgi:hypothetical protein
MPARQPSFCPLSPDRGHLGWIAFTKSRLALRWQGRNDLAAPNPVGKSATGSRAAQGAINAG